MIYMKKAKEHICKNEDEDNSPNIQSDKIIWLHLKNLDNIEKW